MFDVWLILTLMMLVVGVVLRVYRQWLEPIVLQRVSVPVATQIVGEFVQSCYDSEFGFPTGLFRIEEAAPGRLVAREIVSKGSHFTETLGRFYRGVFSFFAIFGMLGFLFGLALAALLTPAFLYAALTEIILRHLLRSEIVVDVVPIHGGTAAHVSLRGPAALLVGRRLVRAFDIPALPHRVAVDAGLVPAPAPA